MKKLTPLYSFSGHNITRSKTRVKFGCGLVNVSKNDLLIVARQIEEVSRLEKELTEAEKKLGNSGSIKRLIRGWNHYSNYADSRDVIRIGAETLKQIAG